MYKIVNMFGRILARRNNTSVIAVLRIRYVCLWHCEPTGCAYINPKQLSIVIFDTVIFWRSPTSEASNLLLKTVPCDTSSSASSLQRQISWAWVAIWRSARAVVRTAWPCGAGSTMDGYCDVCCVCHAGERQGGCCGLCLVRSRGMVVAEDYFALLVFLM